MKPKIWIFLIAIIGVVLMFEISCKKNNDENNNTPLETGTVTDQEGNVYKTVKIGTQWWMAENLRSRKYRNGDTIQNGTTTDSLPAYWNYRNNTSIGNTYGCLYNWYAVTESRNLAPVGWHVPTSAEWDTLIDYLGGYESAGSKLKENGTNTEHWDCSASNADNESGFTALPGGLHLFGTDGGAFLNLNTQGYWWSSTEEENLAYIRIINCLPKIYSTAYLKSYALSVRCVRDE
jgi:uncharacterized protein (TIGR02145 family)